jgi:hypothetical protein
MSSGRVSRSQAPYSHTTADVSAFVAELEQNQPDLFSLKSTENKLQVVKGWLLNAGLIK